MSFRLQGYYNFTFLPEEIDKSGVVPMFLSGSDMTLLQNMLNSEDFKKIRLDPNSGDLDFGDKVLARLVFHIFD